MAALTGALLGLSALNSFAGQRNEARAYDANARFADEQASDAIARGHVATSQLRRDTQGLLGQQRVGYANQGVEIGSGSAADVQTDTTNLSEIDRLMIEHNAQREAFGIRVDAQNQRTAAAATKQRAWGTLLTAGVQGYGLINRDSGATPQRRPAGIGGSV